MAPVKPLTAKEVAARLASAVKKLKPEERNVYGDEARYSRRISFNQVYKPVPSDKYIEIKNIADQLMDIYHEIANTYVLTKEKCETIKTLVNQLREYDQVPGAWMFDKMYNRTNKTFIDGVNCESGKGVIFVKDYVTSSIVSLQGTMARIIPYNLLKRPPGVDPRSVPNANTWSLTEENLNAKPVNDMGPEVPDFLEEFDSLLSKIVEIPNYKNTKEDYTDHLCDQVKSYLKLLHAYNPVSGAKQFSESLSCNFDVDINELTLVLTDLKRYLKIVTPKFTRLPPPPPPPKKINQITDALKRETPKGTPSPKIRVEYRPIPAIGGKKTVRRRSTRNKKVTRTRYRLSRRR